MTFREVFRSIVITGTLLSPLCAGKVTVENKTPETVSITIRGLPNNSGKDPATFIQNVPPGKDITVELDEKEFNGTTFSIQGTTVVAPGFVSLTSNEDVVTGCSAKLVFVKKADGSALVIDKLDRKIISEFFDHKSAEWKNEQEEILEQINKHQQANHIYINEGVRLLELAQNACDLFIRQNASEKRKLLNFVISNSVCDGKNIKAEFKQPFDIIAKSKVKVESETPADLQNIAISEKWLPGTDSNR